MTSRLNPYLNFRGQARAALEFYQHVFGGELRISTFGEFGMPGMPGDQIMHGQLETSLGFTLMASDTPEHISLNVGDNVTVSLSGDDGDELRGYFAALAEAGNVLNPLEKQMWGDEFGNLVDQFGIPWLVNITLPEEQPTS